MNIKAVVLLVFFITQVSAQQQFELPGESQFNDYKGNTVDIVGDTAVVSVPLGNSDNDSELGNAGFVYVYKLIDNNWVIQQKLISDDLGLGDQFGIEVKIFQHRIFIAANSHDNVVDDVTYPDSGAVYVFEESNGQWLQTAKITAQMPAEGAFFGDEIEVGINRLFVGDIGNESGPATGSIHVFDYVAREWVETAIITNDIEYRDNNYLGSWPMSYSNGRLAATVATVTNQTVSGVIHLYEEIDGIWVLTDFIKSPLDPRNDYFGGSISLHGKRLLISNSAEKSGSEDALNGASYLYEWDDNQWNQTTRFTAPNPDMYEIFGHISLLSDDQIIIGAMHSFDGESMVDEGAAFIFNFNGNDWQLSQILEAAGKPGHNEFGVAMAVDFDKLIVGAPYTNERTGAAYVFNIEPNSDRFELNEGLNGNWYNPETAGQGIFLDVKPGLDYAYMGWFTYDTELVADDANGQIGAAGQRWLVGNGTISQSTQSITFDLFYAAGGLFDDPQAVNLSDPNPNGSMTMVFADDCGHAQVSYEVPDQNLFGEFPITRPTAGSLGLCESFSGSGPADQASGFDVSLNGHWYNPETLGQGIFVEQFYGTEQAFMGWFTYDTSNPDSPIVSQVGADGQRWLVGSGVVNADNPNVLDFELLYTSGGLFDDSTTVTVEGADSNATLSIEFFDCGNAEVNYNIPAEKLSGSYDMVKLLSDDQSCE